MHSIDPTAQFPKESFLPKATCDKKKKGRNPSTRCPQAVARRHNAKWQRKANIPDREEESKKPPVLNVWILSNVERSAGVRADDDVITIRVELLAASDEVGSSVVAAVIEDILRIARKIRGGGVDSVIIIVAEVDGGVVRAGDATAGVADDADADIEVDEVADAVLDGGRIGEVPVLAGDGDAEGGLLLVENGASLHVTLLELNLGVACLELGPDFLCSTGLLKGTAGKLTTESDGLNVVHGALGQAEGEDLLKETVG